MLAHNILTTAQVYVRNFALYTQEHHDELCPLSYRTLSAPNRYGAWCEIIPVPTPPPQPAPIGPTPKQVQRCQAPFVGTWPSCHCPTGTTGNRCQNPDVR